MHKKLIWKGSKQQSQQNPHWFNRMWEFKSAKHLIIEIPFLFVNFRIYGENVKQAENNFLHSFSPETSDDDTLDSDTDCSISESPHFPSPFTLFLRLQPIHSTRSFKACYAICDNPIMFISNVILSSKILLTLRKTFALFTSSSLVGRMIFLRACSIHFCRIFFVLSTI